MVATSVFAGAGSIKQVECPCEVRKVDGAIKGSLEALYEFPELFPLVEKLIEKKPLEETDEANLRELAGAMGWSVEDVADDLRNGWGVLWVGLIGIGSCLRNTIARPWSLLIGIFGRRLGGFGAQ